VQLNYNGGASFKGAQIGASVAGSVIQSTPAGVTVNTGGKITSLAGYKQIALPYTNGMPRPESMTTGPDGRLWVATEGDTSSNGLYAIDTATGATQFYPVPASVTLEDLTASSQYLYGMEVAPNAHTVVAFDTNGNIVQTYPDSANVLGINTPDNMLYAPDGNLYMGGGAGTVYELSPSNGQFAKFTAPASLGTCFSEVVVWTFGSDGNLWDECDYSGDLITMNLSTHAFSTAVVDSFGNGTNGALMYGPVLGDDNNFYYFSETQSSGSDSTNYYASYGAGNGGTVANAPIDGCLLSPAAQYLGGVKGKMVVSTFDGCDGDPRGIALFDESSHTLSPLYVDDAMDTNGWPFTVLRNGAGTSTGVAWYESSSSATIGIYQP
jgi:hypothetical protein